jgi:hypothetical protein
MAAVSPANKARASEWDQVTEAASPGHGVSFSILLPEGTWDEFLPIWIDKNAGTQIEKLRISTGCSGMLTETWSGKAKRMITVSPPPQPTVR